MSLKKEDVLGRGIVEKNKTTEGKEKTREKGGYGGASEPTFWFSVLGVLLKTGTLSCGTGWYVVLIT